MDKMGEKNAGFIQNEITPANSDTAAGRETLLSPPTMRRQL